MGIIRRIDVYLFYLLNQVIHCRPLDYFFPFYTHIVGPFGTVFFILAAFLYDLSFGLQLLFSILLCQLVVQIGKRVFHRVRPFNAKDMARIWAQFLPKDPSFPSGHSATAFTFATVAAHIWGFSFLFYPAALLVGISRIYLGVHYPSDVFIGALVGILAAVLIVY